MSKQPVRPELRDRPTYDELALLYQAECQGNARLREMAREQHTRILQLETLVRSLGGEP